MASHRTVDHNQTDHESLVVKHLERWGNHSSIVLLDPTCQIFQAPSIEGVIGYRTGTKTAVVFGDPVCSPEDIPHLTQAFHEQCKNQQKNVLYVSASEQFVKWSIPQQCQAAIGIGEEIIIDPLYNPMADKGKEASLLRNKHNQSLRDGITIHEYTGHDNSIEQQINQVKTAWIANRQGPQIYLLHIDIFSGRSNKRWFYAQQEGTIIAVLMLNRIEAFDGWVLNVLMTLPTAPVATSEFLMLSTLEIIRHEGCRFFSVGTLPGSQLGRIIGLSPLATWIARTTFKVARKFFNLEDRQRYWKKFKPMKKPTFVLCNKTIGFHEVRDLVRAYNFTL